METSRLIDYINQIKRENLTAFDFGDRVIHFINQNEGDLFSYIMGQPNDYFDNHKDQLHDYRIIMIKSDEDNDELTVETTKAFFNVYDSKKMILSNLSYQVFVILEENDFLHGVEALSKIFDTELIENIKIISSPRATKLSDLPRIFRTASTLECFSREINCRFFRYEDNIEKLIGKSLDPDEKENIIQTFEIEHLIQALDEEKLLTAEVFLKNDLNALETSKALYIHRNTLIYRLDKIFKETGLDLRKFDDAWLFKLLISVAGISRIK